MTIEDKRQPKSGKSHSNKLEISRIESARIASKVNSKQRTMKIYILTLITTSILIMILQTFNLNEAKIIKLKDLKKAKKYAYLLAPQRKKLYAIPFPVPLPVFVKRQHIYTQVPVVPRYVQQPNYGSNENGDSYSQDQYSAYSNLDYYSQNKVPSSSSSSSSSSSTSTSSKKSNNNNKQKDEKQQQSASSPSKYFTQLASAIGQAYPGILGANNMGNGNALSSLTANQRDIISKLLTGQAKILAPYQLRSLLSGSKLQFSQMRSPQAPSEQQEQQDRPSNLHDNANSTYGGGKSEPGNKESASELYASSLRSPQSLNSFEHYPGLVPYRIAASNQVHLSPHHMHAMAAQAARLQMLRPHLAAAAAAAAVTNMVPVLDQQFSEPGSNSMETAQHQPDIQEPLASNAQEYELVGSNKQHPEHIFEAMQKQHHELHSALAREKEEARIAESNSLAIAAHQYGLPIIHRPIHLVNY